MKLGDVTVENPRKWMKEKRMRAFTFRNPRVAYEEVDVILDSPLDIAGILRRRRVVRAGGLTVPLISLDDLIETKRRSRRAQGQSDAEALARVKRLRGR